MRERRGAAVGVALVGVLAEWLGFHWDIGWHVDRGRDGFFTGPHLLIVAGLLAAAVAAVVTVQRSGLRARPGMELVAASVGLTGVALTVDTWFHSEFGVDVGMWSPPHLFLSLTILLALIGVIADYARSPRARPWAVCTLVGTFLAVSSLSLAEYDLGYPHFRLLWSPISLALLFGIALGMAAETTRLRWAGTLATACALGLRLAAMGFNASVGRSVPVPPLGLLTGAVVFDLARRRVRLPAAIVLAWAAAFAVQAPWLRVLGKTWWVGPILLPGLLLGVLAVIVGGGLGRASAALLRGRHPRRLAAVVPAALLVVAIGATGWGQLDAKAATRTMSYTSTGHRMQVRVPGARPSDWVSVAGPSRALGLFSQPAPAERKITVVAGSYAPLVQGERLRSVRFLPRLNLTWLGGLTWDGRQFSGRVGGTGEWVGIWYLHGDRVFVSVVERGTTGQVDMAEQALAPLRPPDRWAAPVGVAALMALAALALVLAGRILADDGDTSGQK